MQIPNLLSNITRQWDFYSGRYKAFLAKEESDIQDCIAILEEVRRKELNRVSGDSVLESSVFEGKGIYYHLVACRDIKKDIIVGCMRVNKATDLAKIPKAKNEYRLDLFDEWLMDSVYVFTRLAVLKSHRSTPAALVLMSHAFVDVLERGGQGVVMSCEPNLYSMYQRLGLRPIGSLHNAPSGGYRIPMICLPDELHFQAVQSPALALLKKVDWPIYDEIVQWYRSLEYDSDGIQVGASLFDPQQVQNEELWPITQGLSKRGLQSFLQNAIKIECKEGDLLIANKDGGKFFGIIRKGFGKVVIDGKTIAILSKGDVFGEIAFILDEFRTANVLAGDDETEVVLCSVSLMQRIPYESDRTVIWRNLARIMARRLLDLRGSKATA